MVMEERGYNEPHGIPIHQWIDPGKYVGVNDLFVRFGKAEIARRYYYVHETGMNKGLTTNVCRPDT